MRTKTKKISEYFTNKEIKPIATIEGPFYLSKMWIMGKEVYDQEKTGEPIKWIGKKKPQVNDDGGTSQEDNSKV